MRAPLFGSLSFSPARRRHRCARRGGAARRFCEDRGHQSRAAPGAKRRLVEGGLSPCRGAPRRAQISRLRFCETKPSCEFGFGHLRRKGAGHVRRRAAQIGDRCLAYRPHDAGFRRLRGIRSPSACESTGCLCGRGPRLGWADDRLGLARGAPKPRRAVFPPPSGAQAALYDGPRPTLADALAAGARGAGAKATLGGRSGERGR